MKLISKCILIILSAFGVVSCVEAATGLVQQLPVAITTTLITSDVPHLQAIGVCSRLFPSVRSWLPAWSIKQTILATTAGLVTLGIITVVAVAIMFPIIARRIASDPFVE